MNRRNWHFGPLPDFRPGLRNPLAWIILVLSISLVLLGWSFNNSQIERRAQSIFEAKTEQLRFVIRARLLAQEQILKGGLGFFAGSDSVGREDWKSYVDRLDLSRNYPGIEGLGFAKWTGAEAKAELEASVRREGFPDFKISPPGARPEMSVILFLEPFKGRNLRAFGFDMFSEPIRRAAMIYARDSGTTALSGKVTLVQESQPSRGQAGFLIYVPVYHRGMPVTTVEERRAALKGFVYSPFRMDDLFSAMVPPGTWSLDFKLYDGDVVSDNTLMYGFPRKDIGFHPQTAGRFRRTVKETYYGHTWTLQMAAPAGFSGSIGWNQPNLVLIVGLSGCLLLFLVGITLSSTQARAVSLAKTMTHELRKSGEYLEQRVEERTRQLAEANRAVAESDERLRTSLWASGTGTFRWHFGTQVLDGDDNFHGLFRVRPSDQPISASEWLVNVDPLDRDFLMSALGNCSNGCAPLEKEIRVLIPEGGPIWILVKGRVVPKAGGKPDFMIGAGTDITELKKTELALMEKARVLEENEDRLRQAQKMEAVGRLAGGIAHDFNNLLTAINGYTELCLADIDPEMAAHENLEEIKRAAQRASALTHQLLAYSRRQILEPRLISLNEVVSEMDKLLQRLIGENLRLETRLDPGLPACKVDPGQIQQVIINLVLNARDAMPEGGRILLATGKRTITDSISMEGRPGPIGAGDPLPPGSYVELSVSDNGIGMDQETMQRLFEPYFTTKAAGKGTGLGLSTVYGIIKQSEGGILATSTPGHGSTFRIFLPAVHDAPITAKIPAPAPSAALEGRETLLVAEDEPQVSNFIALTLRRSGYTVILAQDGQEALEKSHSHAGTIDLLLTDIVMPRMGGRELSLKIVETRRNIAIVYMSGYTDDELFRNGIRSDSSSFLQKPFLPNTLLHKIRAILDAKTKASA